MAIHGGLASRSPPRPRGTEPGLQRISGLHLLMDSAKLNRVAGAVGFNAMVRAIYVFAPVVIVCAGGVAHSSSRACG
jgi:succinate dehydrogenase/fumarate reductase flavoprotein subunit